MHARTHTHTHTHTNTHTNARKYTTAIDLSLLHLLHPSLSQVSQLALAASFLALAASFLVYSCSFLALAASFLVSGVITCSLSRGTCECEGPA